MGARGVTTTIPTRSQGQRLDALRIATDIRIAKATLKADIRSGKIGPVHALKDKRRTSMKVEEFLRAVPGIGKVKAHKLCARMEISPYKRISSLSERQLRLLRGALEQFA